MYYQVEVPGAFVHPEGVSVEEPEDDAAADAVEVVVRR